MLTDENKITFSQYTGGFKVFWRHSLLQLNPIFLISSTTSYQIVYHYSNVYLYLPSLKWKSKTKKILWSLCLSPVFLQDSVPVFFMATFLRRVTWNKLYPFPHILFFLNSPASWSFTLANASQLKLFLLSLPSMLQHLTKMCMSSYLWDFLYFLHNWILPSCSWLLWFQHSLGFSSKSLFLLHILYFLLFYLTFIC